MNEKSSRNTQNLINPITLEVLCEGLISIVKEMRANIIRAAYSSVIYEFDDFSCALFGPDGELVAQSWDHPGHVLPLPWGVNCVLEEFRSDLHPGDAILLNDPYMGGTHLNDVTLMYPLFDEAGQLIVFPAVRAHWVDVGGMVPGSYSGLSTNVYQEGVRIPPIKILENGKLNRAAMTLLMANMRVPEEREGDFNASLGASKVAEGRIRKLIERYGWNTLKNAIAVNLDRTESRLREKISALPDGDYFYEDYLEFYNEGQLDPVLAQIKLTVAGDQITADFNGTNPQVPGVVNSSLAVVGAGVFVAIKSTLDPGGAVNQGAFRPITLKAPEASIFNVSLDAPAGAHGEVRKRAVSVTLGALAQIIPDLVSADLCGSSFPNAIGGFNNRRNRPYVYYEAPAGGNGGFREADGPSAYVNVDFGNLPSIQNVESIECEMPIMINSCTLRMDGGGEGARRGGVGMQREVRLIDEEGTYSVLSDRAVIPPWGVLGGQSGKPYHLSIHRDGNIIEFETPGKVTGHPIKRDDIVVMCSSGGGGYGDPLDRETDRVLEDVNYGYVSIDRARSGYGVVIATDGSIDDGATLTLRAELKSKRVRLKLIIDDTIDPYVGAKGRRRILTLAASDASRLNVAHDDLVELLGKNPAPLRAWVRSATDVTPGTVRMDAFGQKVLGLSDGDETTLVAVSTPQLPRGMGDAN
jgi:N-methylhydantoinase B|tara:strand:- start:501 stop:2585 length:2085 start_codon:yes stop_codon:yes gene_type:complete